MEPSLVVEAFLGDRNGCVLRLLGQRMEVNDMEALNHTDIDRQFSEKQN